ncbi:MAG: hypothetical protein ACLTLQ_01875 [[Clostridium] scindens]
MRLERWISAVADFARLAGEFRVDDHSYWPADDDQKKQSQIENQWQDDIKASRWRRIRWRHFSKEGTSTGIRAIR